MKHGVIFLLSALLALPLAVRADTNPDFDDDAKPILRTQPNLLHYVESHFEVKDTGTAKYPGDDDRRPGPPYIFRARPAGSNGPYNLRLLIQPGPPGHVLGVVDITKVHMNEPGAAPQAPVAGEPPAAQGPNGEPQVGQAFSPPAYPGAAPTPVPSEPTPAPAPAPAPSPSASPSAPAANTAPSEPSADTPSGPIMGSSSSSGASPQQSLAPPPDPAPNTQ